jgi:hypothetical protein
VYDFSAVDTDGRVLLVNLTWADVQDAQGAEPIIKAVWGRAWVITHGLMLVRSVTTKRMSNTHLFYASAGPVATPQEVQARG